ncbi:MAG: ComEC/Rec2 family competence protein, partial [Planctomycetota bacterium]
DGLSLWSVALLFENLRDPLALQGLSVSLSFGATLALLLGWPVWQQYWLNHLRDPLEARLVAPISRAGWPRSPWFSALMPGVIAFVAHSLMASWIASFGTLPLVALSFGEWSPIGSLATLTVMPLLVLFLCFALPFVLVPTLLPLTLARWPLESMVWMLDAWDRGPGTPQLLASHAGPALAVAALAAFGLRLGYQKGPCLRTMFLAAGAAFVPLHPWPNELVVHVCDVGHGTAIVAQLPCGCTLLYDAGSRDRLSVARRALLPLLRELNPGPVLLALSHVQRDHAGAFAQVAPRLNVTGCAGPIQEVVPARDLPAGSALRCDRGRATWTCCARSECRLTWLHGLDVPGNEGSRSLLIEWRGNRVLLSGDAEADGLADLLPVLRAGPPLDALVMPHHGSRQPLWSELLAAARPREVWCSGGPSSPLAREWRAAFPSLRWTAKDGGWTARFPAKDPDSVDSG